MLVNWSLLLVSVHSSNATNAWNVNSNNRNVNNNTASNSSNNGVRPATFFKTMNFWTSMILKY